LTRSTKEYLVNSAITNIPLYLAGEEFALVWSRYTGCIV